MTHDEIRRQMRDGIALLLTLFGEARGEPIEGQIAVGNVIRNRVRQGKKWAAVCLAPAQFSCWFEEASPNTAGLYLIAEALLLSVTPPVIPTEKPAFQQCGWLATGLMAGDVLDNTGGALNYVSEALYQSPKCPAWARTAKSSVLLGSQRFLRGVS